MERKSEETGKWPDMAPYMLSVLRIVPAFMFMLTGTMLLFAFPKSMDKDGSTVHLMSQMGIGAILEFVGGFFLLIGLFTRPVAFILCGEMAVAYFQFHAPDGLWPMANGGTGAVLYCFIFLYISFAGAGPLSLDAWLRNKKSKIS